MADVTTIAGGVNLEVRNQNGVDMFADSTDNSPSHGPNGASDGTIPNGSNATLIVQHPDYAWRAHSDATFGSGFSQWRSCGSGRQWHGEVRRDVQRSVLEL